MTEKSRNMLLFCLIAFAALGSSQVVGYWINSTIPQNTSMEINSFLRFTHIRNLGGIFGLFQGRGLIFAGFSICLLTGLVIYLWRSTALKFHEYICWGFIVGGGTSNILDRFIYGGVIDFIEVRHIPFWNYIFNTADMMVHAGLWPMIVFTVFFEKTDSAKN